MGACMCMQKILLLEHENVIQRARRNLCEVSNYKKAQIAQGKKYIACSYVAAFTNYVIHYTGCRSIL